MSTVHLIVRSKGGTLVIEQIWWVQDVVITIYSYGKKINVQDSATYSWKKRILGQNQFGRID